MTRLGYGVGIALALVIALTGCAETGKWVVLDPESKGGPTVSEKVIALNAKYRPNFIKLAKALNVGRIKSGEQDGKLWRNTTRGRHLSSGRKVTNSWHYVTFTEHKGEPSITILVGSAIIYNIQQTTKVSRAASSFSENIPRVLTNLGDVGLLVSSPDYRLVHLGVSYDTEDFSIGGVLRMASIENENAEFFIPVDLAQQYLNQDISVQELLAKSIVIVDGEKNDIKTQDRAIN